MKSFKYTSSNEAVAENNDLRKVYKKKINRQRMIYLILFIVCLFLFAYYLLYRSFIVSINGQVKFLPYHVTLPEDAYITDILCRPGDIVKEGDTLFMLSYTPYLTQGFDNYLESIQINYNPDWKEKELMQVRLRIQHLQIELQKVNMQIVDYRKQIEKMRNGTFLGVFTPRDLEQLEAKLTNAEIERKTILQEINAQNQYLNQVNGAKSSQSTVDVNGRGGNGGGGNGSGLQGMVRGRMYQYQMPFISSYAGLVYSVSLIPDEICYKKESVVNILPENIEHSDLHVQAYVPFKYAKLLNINDTLEVRYGDAQMYKVVMKQYLPETDFLPENFMGILDHKEPVALARFEFVDKSLLTKNNQINNLPVEINVHRFPFMRKIASWF